MVKVKVRGIYSTALTKFFLDQGYEITFPSAKQRERFGIENYSRADVCVKDSEDRRGIIIYGYKECVEPIIKVLEENFWDSFFIRDLGKIVHGKKVGEDGKYYIFETELGEVRVKKEENPRDEEIIQIFKISKGKYYGTLKIVKPGTFVEIIKDSPNIIDFRVPKEKLLEYENLLKLLGKEGWGVKLKYEAKLASYEDLIDEIQDLFEKDIKFCKIYFGFESIRKLDAFRDKVLRTIDFHHMYRRNSLFSKIVDFAEILIERYDKEILNDGLKKYSLRLINETGRIKKYHFKWYGLSFVKTELVVEAKLNSEIYIKTKRLIIPKTKFYDGLNIEIEPGDYAISEYKFGNPYFRIKYYKKNGELKGEYININSPLEIVGNRIYYNDLEVDIVKVKDEVRITDLEELEELFKRKIITEKYYKHVLDLVQDLKTRV